MLAHVTPALANSRLLAFSRLLAVDLSDYWCDVDAAGLPVAIPSIHARFEHSRVARGERRKG